MAAVKLLVIEAMRNTVSAVGSVSRPATAVPTPRVWTSSPSTITPYATPGTGSLSTNASTQAIHLSQRVVDRHAPDYSRA